MWKNVRGIPLNGIEFAYRDCLIMFGIFDTMWLWRFNEIQCQRNQETDANSACHCSFWKFLGLWSKLNRILSSSDAGTCITSRANQTLQTLAHPEQGTKEPCGECTPGRAQQLLWLAIRLESLALSARRHQHEKWTGHGKARHQAHPSARELDDQSQQPALPRRQRTQGLHLSGALEKRTESLTGLLLSAEPLPVQSRLHPLAKDTPPRNLHPCTIGDTSHWGTLESHHCKRMPDAGLICTLCRLPWKTHCLWVAPRYRVAQAENAEAESFWSCPWRCSANSFLSWIAHCWSWLAVFRSDVRLVVRWLYGHLVSSNLLRQTWRLLWSRCRRPHASNS